ncbi:unnamed protein product [Lactuca saligna]|uniref:Uncharacterized protein n=1 Tax=Lactuca saligna TaxID=75948 RepID=A0AA36E5D6_LACSI|nr:unnamed protein product [Lactuca saligna]
MNTHPRLHPHPPPMVASGGGRRKKRQQRDSEHNSPFGVATMTGANKSDPAAADGAGGLAILDFTGSNQHHSNGRSCSINGDKHTTITSPTPFTCCDVPAIRQSSACCQRESPVVIRSFGALTDQEGKRGVGW